MEILRIKLARICMQLAIRLDGELTDDFALSRADDLLGDGTNYHSLVA